MRKTLITAAVLLAGISVPMAASADPYRNHCYNDGNDQMAGAIVGGLLGGVLGSNVADRGSRTSGTIIGGALGAAAGAAIAGSGNDCGYAPRYGYNNGVRTSYSIGVSSGYGSYYPNNYYGYGYANPGYYGRVVPAPRPVYRQPAPRYYGERHDNRRVDVPRRDHRYDNRRHERQGAYYGGHQQGSVQYRAQAGNGSAFVIAAGQTRPSTCRTSTRRVQNWDGSTRVVRGQQCLTVGGSYRDYGF